MTKPTVLPLGEDLEKSLPTFRRVARFLRLGPDQERSARVLACLALAVRELRSRPALPAPSVDEPLPAPGGIGTQEPIPADPEPA